MKRVLTERNEVNPDADRVRLRGRFQRLVRAVKSIAGMPLLPTHELLGLSKDTCDNYAREACPRRLQAATQRMIVQTVGRHLGTELGQAMVAAVLAAMDSADEAEFEGLILRLEACKISDSLAGGGAGRRLPVGLPTPKQVGRCLLHSLAGPLQAAPVDRLEEMVAEHLPPSEVVGIPPYTAGGQRLALCRAGLCTADGTYSLDFELYTCTESADFDITKPEFEINIAAADPRHADALQASCDSHRFELLPVSFQRPSRRRSLPLLGDNGLCPGVQTLISPFQVRVSVNDSRGAAR